MHVLTKIFVVLVSLLAVLLVPLVVVYAHNEDSFKSKYQTADSRAVAASARLKNEQLAYESQLGALRSEVQGQQAANATIARERDTATAEIRDLETSLAQAQSQQDRIRADLAKLSSAVAAGQQLLEQLLQEVATTRSEALAAERRSLELDEAVREAQGQLEVAIAARRAMQEELQQLKEELTSAMEKNSLYAEKFGPLESELLLAAPPQMKDLDATVLNVRRGLDQTLAEINAGSRDGVEEGWIMMIGRRGEFLGNLRIIEVDINRATGVVELEAPDARGRVEAGDRVYARRRHS